MLLRDVTAVLDEWFDPRWAEAWDAVGLVCGDPGESVERVLLAVDAVPATVEEALGIGADLLITHHPLLLAGVSGVPVSDPKGALVHRMIRGGVAHLVAHTNADVADPGVSDALAGLFGLRDTVPLAPQGDPALDKLVVFVPHDRAQQVIDALSGAGAGAIGDYERCAWTTTGTGTFRALPGAHPAIGRVGAMEQVPETRVEMVLPTHRRAAAVAAMRAAHPYEEPAFDLLAQVPLPSSRGTGRIGDLRHPSRLREFTTLAAQVLPRTAGGVRSAGDLDSTVRRVAVCGGSGASVAELARAGGADVFLTADLKHHAVIEAVTERGATMAMVDAAHWATEAPWLDALAPRLRERLGTTVEVHVSRTVTDPWTLHARPDDLPSGAP